LVGKTREGEDKVGIWRGTETMIKKKDQIPGGNSVSIEKNPYLYAQRKGKAAVSFGGGGGYGAFGKGNGPD